MLIILFLSPGSHSAVAGPTPSAALTGRHPLGRVGLWVQFERRGWASGYYPGELIRNFDQFDKAVGSLVSDETSLQLDKMKAMGVNTISFELRTSDPDTYPVCPPQSFPSCEVCWAVGLDWPQPTKAELTNLKALFDLVESKGMKVDLVLTTTHMDESPPTNSKIWLGSVFDTVKGHPALDLVVIGGDAHTVDTNGDGRPDACGSQGSEPPIWLGPSSYAATYLEWVIPFAISRGIPAHQLCAEAIIGAYLLDSEHPAGPDATDHHLWSPIKIMKGIFDKLNIPASERRYAVSFYEERKCLDPRIGPGCLDVDPHDWADQTLAGVISVIGNKQKSQIIMIEGGTNDPEHWPAEHAFESIGFLMQKYGLPGGNFWRWAAYQNSEDTDPTLAKAVKKRGVSFTYFPPEKEIIDLGGFHLSSIPNGSFEQGTTNKVPSLWTVSGSGTGIKYFLAGEPGEPQVPSRGKYDLRLTTGTAPGATITGTSQMIGVSPNRTYTTTGNLRFSWTGDPNPSGPSASRPQVFLIFKYFKKTGAASAVKTEDSFRFFQENSTKQFRTFPMQYTTPSDASLVQIVAGASRNGLPSKIVFDVDNLR